MSAAEFSNWAFLNLDLDTWLTEASLARRLAGIRDHTLSAPALLGALIRAGWLEAHPTYESTFCLPSRCCLPRKLP